MLIEGYCDNNSMCSEEEYYEKSKEQISEILKLLEELDYKEGNKC